MAASSITLLICDSYTHLCLTQILLTLLMVIEPCQLLNIIQGKGVRPIQSKWQVR